jgi:LPS O-antigen subunit length determinant protein (WzzB/FepE family)
VKVEYFNSFISKHDPRFFGNIENLMKCNFMAATTNQPNSVLDKLYSSFLPSMESFKKYIERLKNDYSCIGNQSGFFNVREDSVSQAIEIAKSQKIKFEPSGIAGLALLMQMKDSVPKDSKILIVNTGKTKALSDLLKSN